MSVPCSSTSRSLNPPLTPAVILPALVILSVLGGCAASKVVPPADPSTRSEVMEDRSAMPAQDQVKTQPFLPGLGEAVGQTPYRIGLDDKLEISVYNDRDLVKTQAVRPDGKIAFPLVGEIYVAGSVRSDAGRQLTRGCGSSTRLHRMSWIASSLRRKPIRK